MRSAQSTSPAASEDPLGVGADRLDVGGEAQVGRRAPQALEVLVERERPPAVEAHHLEDAVAAQQPLVGGGDARLLGGPERAVQAREQGGRRGGVGHGAGQTTRAQAGAEWAVKESNLQPWD